MAFAGFVYLCLPSRVKEPFGDAPAAAAITPPACTALKGEFDSVDATMNDLQKRLIDNIKTFNTIRTSVGELKGLAKNANC
jgi:hypothetical protein